MMKINIFFGLLLFILFGCSSSNEKKEYELLYWSSNNSQEIEFAKMVISKWNAMHPEAKVQYQPVPEGQSSEEIILAAVVGQTTPDVYSNMWQGDVEIYAESGSLVALDTLEGFDEYIYDRCDTSVMVENTSLDNHIYQIPWKINPILMIYNKNHIKNLGLDHAPSTYDEYFDAAEKFKKDKDGDGYVDQWFGYSEVLVTWWQRFFDFYPLYLAASGGQPLIKNNKADFDNEYAVNVFKFLRELYKQKYFPQERLAAREDPFLSGTIVTRFTGPWEISHAEKYKPDGFEYGFQHIPVPAGFKGPIYTYGDPKNIVIFNTCKKPNLAFQFAKFLTSKKNDFQLLKLTSQYPRRKDLLTDSLFVNYFEKNPELRVFAEQAKYVRGTDASSVLKEVFDIISQEYEACVIYGTKTPEEAIKDAAFAVNLLNL
ncbi:MAG: extracellular solute-binding protein [Bacteroidetes bacterium]|nr:extracellular solute-binding protein [Bacteroidota bacterium]MBU1114056.1 extracellular solute-binding protein [Bacteroidota bacterium]MBU1798935.1 extracellular solute-binding protein [Bacteroidota bacterium]